MRFVEHGRILCPGGMGRSGAERKRTVHHADWPGVDNDETRIVLCRPMNWV